MAGNTARYDEHLERAVDRRSLNDIAFDANPFPMYVYDLETFRFLHVNAAAVATYGYAAADFAAMTLFDIRPDEDRERLATWLDEFAAHDDLLPTTGWRHRRKDGSIIVVDTANSRTFTFDGRDARLVIAVDVTERNARIDDLRTAQAALEAAHEVGGLGSFHLDLRTKMFRMSGATKRAFGGSELSLADAPPVLARVVPDPAAIARYLDSLERVEPIDVEHPFLLDGELRWSHTRTHVVRNAHGEPTHIAGVMIDITERRGHTERLTTLAYTDLATGLPNRAALLGRAEACVPGTTMALVVFAGVGGVSLGSHDSRSDAANAQAITGVLQRAARSGAAIARYSDDTWAVTAPCTGRTRSALPLAKRIMSAFDAPIVVGDDEIVVIPTIGVAAAFEEACPLAELARRAETALKAAQGDERRLAEYSRDLERAHERRAQLERHLRHAIVDRRVDVAYQPIVSLSNGRIVGAEALMRWSCPRFGPIAPSEFIAMAEESGMILRLGEWILREACAQNRRWQIAGAGRLRIAVNVSARQLQQREFVRLVGSICETTGLPPADLELEVTESTMMHRDGLAIRNLEALRRLGVRVSIDDFGTGYSSLSYLKALPIDALKMDRSFVAPIADDSFQAEVAQTVVTLAHRRGLTVIGEGVETLEQVTGLRAMGCDEAQGFLFGVPMSAEEFRARLDRDRFGIAAADQAGGTP